MHCQAIMYSVTFRVAMRITTFPHIKYYFSGTDTLTLTKQPSQLSPLVHQQSNKLLPENLKTDGCS